ncbi:MAG: allophanate hydrolase subunit 1, partial [Actinomycetota bacterium]
NDGVIEVVPGYVNAFVVFDPLTTDHDAVATAIRDALAQPSTTDPAGALHRLPVCYDGALAPDLSDVASAVGLSEEEVIDAHLGGRYRVEMFGFAPGYGYLSGVPEAIRVPRKPTPVRDVPAGSVIVADAQCLVTTLTMPTGWSVIGRSPAPIFTADETRPVRFDVGDRIEFERIDRAEFERLEALR